jgi:hypothetical protein
MKNTLPVNSLILVIFLFYPLTVFSQKYLWPTNASEYMSSSFCEFREGHYHSAIDIKTWNTEGYPCYAIEDGYIKRIRFISSAKRWKHGCLCPFAKIHQRN